MMREDRAKRLLDMTLVVATSWLWLPLLCVVAAGVRLALGAPVLFRHVRPGRGGELFLLYKFRTMTERRGPDGNLLPDAQRLTRFGRFLRATSLDELPEFWNVLKGDMSLVGPRPLLVEYLPLYTERQRRRHEVRPGMTGWAQVNGRNAIDWEQRFELDVWYVEHRSIALDLRILARTLRIVLARRGISGRGEATMSRFEGTR